MKKKTYQQPKMEVVEFDQADIICTSTPGTFSLGDDANIEEGDDADWGNNLGW